MRTLLLLRGAPGVGKTTFIENNGLTPYALSADSIRLLCQAPVLMPNGTHGISQSNDGFVWKTLFNILEMRMKLGEFTVIDATNSKTSEMKRYKKLATEYRYRIYCVDFTDVPIDEVKKRNANREPYKRVPEQVIDNMYARFATQQIPSGIKAIKPDEINKIHFSSIDLSSYKKIHHIGDVHGCYTVLKQYIDENGGIKDDEFYIFTGDYIDRGVENKEVLEYLLSIQNLSNILMLEGNHERWIWDYANDRAARSREFENVTKSQLETLSKKDLRVFYRALGQCAYYTYHDKTVFVTHAGLSMLPENLTLVATEQMIKGVGSYDEAKKCDNTFANTTSSNVYQIHGHRNRENLPVQVNEKCYNLEGQVEFGGHLRCVQLTSAGFNCIELKNNVYKLPVTESADIPIADTVDGVIQSLRDNKYVNEKQFGHISSFNFTKKAFYDKIWNAQTIKARGLFLNTNNGSVVARSYDKFFNINEIASTKLEVLQNTLKFPVACYVKENGFLGIVSYDKEKGGLFVASKSSINGFFVDMLHERLGNDFSEQKLMKITEYVKTNNVSLVFECIDVKNDPHIIEYKESNLVLLDIVYNDIAYKKMDYEAMVQVATRLGLRYKKKAFELANWQEFIEWYDEVTSNRYEFEDGHIEGFVIEDSNGYMVKVKLAYYNFWKFMRSISHETITKGHTKKTSALTSPLANVYYAWIKNLVATKGSENIPKDICSLRKMFYEEKLGGTNEH